MKESEEEEEVSTQHQGQHQDHGWGLTQHPPGLPLHHPLVRCQTRAVAATLPPCLPGTSWEVRDGGRGASWESVMPREEQPSGPEDQGACLPLRSPAAGSVGQTEGTGERGE